MKLTRKQLLWGSSATLLGAPDASARERRPEAQSDASAQTSAVHAVLFDAFAIFDPKSLLPRIDRLYPGKSAGFLDAFRRRLFEYTWLRAAAGRYADFSALSEAALDYAAFALALALSATQRSFLVGGLSTLSAYPDVAGGLERLRASSHVLGLLSNLTPSMLAGSLKSATLHTQFIHVLSTDRVRTYKPDRRAYALGTSATKLRPEQILFVASAAWDAAGANWFGYRTLWLNRSKAPPELEVPANATVTSFPDLVTAAQNLPTAATRSSTLSSPNPP